MLESLKTWKVAVRMEKPPFLCSGHTWTALLCLLLALSKASFALVGQGQLSYGVALRHLPGPHSCVKGALGRRGDEPVAVTVSLRGTAVPPAELLPRQLAARGRG